MQTLTIGVTAKGKAAIIAGAVIMAKFKNVEAAKTALKNNGELYAYWANSVSVSVQNSIKKGDYTIIEA